MQTIAQVQLEDAGLHVRSPWVQISYLPLKVLQRAHRHRDSKKELNSLGRLQSSLGCIFFLPRDTVHRDALNKINI